MNTKITSIALISLGLLYSSCTRNALCVKGKGDRITEIRTTDTFSEITLEGSADILLIQDPDINEAQIEIKGQENIIEELRTDVQGDELIIDFKHCVNYQRALDITIRTNDLSRIDIKGSGDIRTLVEFQGTNLSANIDGSGDMDMQIKYQNIEVGIDGSGDIDLDGSSDRLEAHIKGSGDLKAYSLETKDADIRINGSGNAQVNVSKSLKVRINGSGNLRYMGSPTMDVDINGSGDVRRK